MLSGRQHIFSLVSGHCGEPKNFLQVSQVEAILRLSCGLLRHIWPKVPRLIENYVKFAPKIIQMWFIQRLPNLKNVLFLVVFYSYFWKSWKKEHGTKICRFGSHFGLILGYFGGLWRPFWASWPTWANVERSGAILGPTWSHLKPTWPQHKPTWANMEPQKPFWMAQKGCNWYCGWL